MKTRDVVTLWAALLTGITLPLCAWFYFTPHLTVRAMGDAGEAGDAARLAAYVNFPALRTNLKSTLISRAAADAASSKGRDPDSAVGALATAAMIGSLAEPLLDIFVTPESLALALPGVQAWIEERRKNNGLVRIPLIVDTHSRLIADSVPSDRGHPLQVS